MGSLKPHQPVVASLLNERRPRTILDAPSGSGWLAPLLDFEFEIDGLDLYAAAPAGYRSFRHEDLDEGLPADTGGYDAIVCCEGIEHFASPGRFLRSAWRHLKPGGVLVVTTPNTWHPHARVAYALRGFFPSFPCLVGRIEPGTHMHIMPWSFPQLFLHLRLSGFERISLHEIDEPKPKRAYETLLALPQRMYCARRRRRAGSEEERAFWLSAGSGQSVFGRRLVVSAVPAPVQDVRLID